MNRLIALPIVVLLAFAVAACGGESTQSVTIAERVALEIPDDMEPQGLQGFDSAVGGWTNGELELTYDLGSHSDPLGYNEHDEFRVSILTIDGLEATIEYFRDGEGDPGRPWVAALHIANLGNGDKLTMYARSADEDGQDVATRIFRSIETLDGGRS